MIVTVVPLLKQMVELLKLIPVALARTVSMVTGQLVPWLATLPVLMLIAFLLGIGLGGAQPMIMSLLYNTAPAGRGGEAIAIRTLLINISQTAIPLMFGALGAALGMTPVFWTMSVLLVGAGYYVRKPSGGTA